MIPIPHILGEEDNIILKIVFTVEYEFQYCTSTSTSITPLHTRKELALTTYSCESLV